MEKAKQADEVKTRTCVPKWNGLKYIRAVARHFNSEWITDKEAVSLLDAGFLKPEDFKVMPGGVTIPDVPATAAVAKPKAAPRKKAKK